MAVGVSVALPLSRDPENGYRMNVDIVSSVKQNLKMLILTAPGERIMDRRFGVGLRNYLFRQNTTATRTELSANIQSQVRKYMSFLDILSIKFNDAETAENVLSIAISYKIKPLNVADILALAVQL